MPLVECEKGVQWIPAIARWKLVLPHPVKKNTAVDSCTEFMKTPYGDHTYGFKTPEQIPECPCSHVPFRMERWYRKITAHQTQLEHVLRRQHVDEGGERH